MGGDTRAAPTGMWPQRRSLGFVPAVFGWHRGAEAGCAPPALPFLLLQVLMLADGDSAGFLYRQLPFLSSLERKDGKATAYLCSNFTCSLPVTSPQELRGLLCQ